MISILSPQGYTVFNTGQNHGFFPWPFLSWFRIFSHEKQNIRLIPRTRDPRYRVRRYRDFAALCLQRGLFRERAIGRDAGACRRCREPYFLAARDFHVSQICHFGAAGGLRGGGRVFRAARIAAGQYRKRHRPHFFFAHVRGGIAARRGHYHPGDFRAFGGGMTQGGGAESRTSGHTDNPVNPGGRFLIPEKRFPDDRKNLRAGHAPVVCVHRLALIRPNPAPSGNHRDGPQSAQRHPAPANARYQGHPASRRGRIFGADRERGAVCRPLTFLSQADPDQLVLHRFPGARAELCGTGGIFAGWRNGP